MRAAWDAAPQFLFAFLLIAPFQPRATQMSEFQQEVYFTTLVAAAVATGLLIAPAAQHRLLFRQQDEESLLRRSNWSALAGLAVLAVAIASAILLVIDVLFGRTRAWWITGAVAALLLWWWIVVPVWTRMRNPQNSLDKATGNEGSATWPVCRDRCSNRVRTRAGAFDIPLLGAVGPRRRSVTPTNG
ncbi:MULTISPECIES: DUF6328 family protein [unclassified Modestobacter]|uniref:DUF6328 family protein n=1 Tax=unclassified Modestobacter TaxID=2643866 RepID=UPI0022AB1F7D|nr:MULTISPECIES: DUF6328 family protein [unclassified Modestobacter]MCZ2826666.1 DUF6328 family protein [Modestobacter sp. VKM Ac-2981]MCZ2855046.1 DUF6328 family protein [Modestobacter sp. VKM Ac-2982]